MTICWAARFPRLELGQIGRMWDVERVEVCVEPETVWLRGGKLSGQVEEILRGFLSGKRFLVLPDGQIQSPKDRVPKGYLPDGPWIALRDWMTVGLPPAALPGRCDSRLPLKLVPSSKVADADILLTQLDAWLAWGSRAAQVRLDPLSFAMTSARAPRPATLLRKSSPQETRSNRQSCEEGLGEGLGEGNRHGVLCPAPLAADGTVLVRGRPLPSMPGRRLVEYDGIAVPAGLAWSPAVEAAVLRELFELNPGDLAVLEPDESWYRIRSDSFVRATRQAIRTS